MSIARSSTLKNEYRYVTVAVDNCFCGQPEGTMYHASRARGIPFFGYLELAWELDTVTQGRAYPMRSMEQRSLSGRERRDKQDRPHLWLPEAEPPEAYTKRLATFRVFIKSRYYASWQGLVVWEDTGQIIVYRSFLELMHIINELLAVRAPVPEPGLILNFGSMKELTGKLDALFDEPVNRTVTTVAVYREKGQTATFSIRLLFCENETYQGSISRKETGERRHFRSFLELLMMIDEDIRDSAVLTKDHRQAIAL